MSSFDCQSIYLAAGGQQKDLTPNLKVNSKMYSFQFHISLKLFTLTCKENGTKQFEWKPRPHQKVAWNRQRTNVHQCQNEQQQQYGGQNKSNYDNSTNWTTMIAANQDFGCHATQLRKIRPMTNFL
jgi:hypothetical protein